MLKENELLTKMGMNKGDIIQLFTFQELSTESMHAAKIYQRFTEMFPGDIHSRTYVYKSIKSMEAKGWIYSVKNGKKIDYSITPAGKKIYQEYILKYKPSLMNAKKIINNILQSITDTTFLPDDIIVDEKTKQMTSKLVNIKEIIQSFILSSLQSQSTYGGQLYSFMKEKYGWQPSHGYFYSILREMDIGTTAGWLQSYWDDHKNRGKRIYQLTSVGELALSNLEQKVVYDLRQARNYINELLPIFEEK